MHTDLVNLIVNPKVRHKLPSILAGLFLIRIITRIAWVEISKGVFVKLLGL